MLNDCNSTGDEYSTMGSVWHRFASAMRIKYDFFDDLLQLRTIQANKHRL
jgi:hypothetical protein